MDAFDKLKELAREKNKEALSKLLGHPKAIDIVKVLADDADLEIWPLTPSDSLLNGALAVLAREDGAIYHANNLSEEEVAVLVGHELAHYYMHGTLGGSSCSRDDIDVAVSSEASPVGADRVAGYGAKERRELQANVFSRELLLPQPQARTLYLDKAKTPENIASDTGLPLAVVRQQLIDALFIPIDSNSETETRDHDSPLDSFQAEAAKFSGAPLLLKLAPGQGKRGL